MWMAIRSFKRISILFFTYIVSRNSIRGDRVYCIYIWSILDNHELYKVCTLSIPLELFAAGTASFYYTVHALHRSSTWHIMSSMHALRMYWQRAQCKPFVLYTFVCVCRVPISLTVSITHSIVHRHFILWGQLFWAAEEKRVPYPPVQRTRGSVPEPRLGRRSRRNS